MPDDPRTSRFMPTNLPGSDVTMVAREGPYFSGTSKPLHFWPRRGKTAGLRKGAPMSPASTVPTSVLVTASFGLASLVYVDGCHPERPPQGTGHGHENPTDGGSVTTGPVPPPPAAPGCYKYETTEREPSKRRWTRVNCMSPDEEKHLPHPAIGGASGVYGLQSPCEGPCATNSYSPLTAAAVSVSFAPFCNPSIVPCSSDSPVYAATDSLTGRESLGVQLNTNTFPVSCHPGSLSSGQDQCVPGDIGWVQFTYQADVGTGGPFYYGASGLCVWNVDLTQNQFFQNCIGIPNVYGFQTGGQSTSSPRWETPAPFQVTGGESNQMLWVMACPPWGEGPCWSVATPDVLGLCWDPTSSQCSWQWATGSLLGMGNSSVENFPPGVTMYTGIAAAACSPPSSYVPGFTPFPPPGWDFIPMSSPALACPAPSTANAPSYSNGGPLSDFTTGESNNLTPNFDPASALVQACVEGTCWITYCASDSNGCPSGP